MLGGRSRNVMKQVRISTQSSSWEEGIHKGFRLFNPSLGIESQSAIHGTQVILAQGSHFANSEQQQDNCSTG